MIDDSEFDDIFDDEVDFQDIIGEEDHPESGPIDPESESIRQLMDTLNHAGYSDKFLDYFKVTTLLVNAVIDDQVSRMNQFSEAQPLLQTAIEMMLKEYYGESWKHILVAQHLAKIQSNANIEELKAEFEDVLDDIDETMESIDPEEDSQAYGFLEVFKSNVSVVLFCFDVLDNYIDRTVVRFTNSPDKLVANMGSHQREETGSPFDENMYLQEMKTVLYEMLSNLKKDQGSEAE